MFILNFLPQRTVIEFADRCHKYYICVTVYFLHLKTFLFFRNRSVLYFKEKTVIFSKKLPVVADRFCT